MHSYQNERGEQGSEAAVALRSLVGAQMSCWFYWGHGRISPSERERTSLVVCQRAVGRCRPDAAGPGAPDAQSLMARSPAYLRSQMTRRLLLWCV